MKTKLLFTFLITSFYLQAQVSDFVTGLTNEPSRLIIDNNIIYVTGVSTPAEILEIDLTDSNPSSNVTFTTANGFGISGIFKEGDIMYFAMYDENTGESSLISFNVNTPNSTTTISSSLGYVATIAKFNDELYFTEENLSSGDTVLKKVDVTITNPPVETVVTGLTNPQDMQFNGDVLYIGDRDAGGGIGIIYSVDITLAMPMLNSFVTNANVRGVYVYNEFLYFSDAGIIKKTEFTNPSNITTEAFDNDGDPEFLRDVVISGTNLYMPQEDSGKIVTREDLTLSNEQFISQQDGLSVTNTLEQLEVKGLQNTLDARIYNLSGQQVMTKKVDAADNFMNISALSTGVYILKIENSLTYKFIKRH